MFGFEMPADRLGIKPKEPTSRGADLVERNRFENWASLCAGKTVITQVAKQSSSCISVQTSGTGSLD